MRSEEAAGRGRHNAHLRIRGDKFVIKAISRLLSPACNSGLSCRQATAYGKDPSILLQYPLVLLDPPDAPDPVCMPYDISKVHGESDAFIPHEGGYLRVRTTDEDIEYGHRLVALAFLGPPPAGHDHVLHSCNNPKCLSPLHLRWGTHADNTKDRIQKWQKKKSTPTHDAESIPTPRKKRRALHFV